MDIGVKSNIEFLADKNHRVHCDLPIELGAIWVHCASIAMHYLKLDIKVAIILSVAILTRNLPEFFLPRSDSNLN